MSDVYSSITEEPFCCCLFFSPSLYLSCHSQSPSRHVGSKNKRNKTWTVVEEGSGLDVWQQLGLKTERQGGLAGSPGLFFSLHAVLLPTSGRTLLFASQIQCVWGVAAECYDWFPNKHTKTQTPKWMLSSSKSLPCKASHLFLSHYHFSEPSGNVSWFISIGSLIHWIKKWIISPGRNLGWSVQTSVSLFCGHTLDRETDSVLSFLFHWTFQVFYFN